MSDLGSNSFGFDIRIAQNKPGSSYVKISCKAANGELVGYASGNAKEVSGDGQIFGFFGDNQCTGPFPAFLRSQVETYDLCVEVPNCDVVGGANCYGSLGECNDTPFQSVLYYCVRTKVGGSGGPGICCGSAIEGGWICLNNYSGSLSECAAQDHYAGRTAFFSGVGCEQCGSLPVQYPLSYEPGGQTEPLSPEGSFGGAINVIPISLYDPSIHEIVSGPFDSGGGCDVSSSSVSSDGGVASSSSSSSSSGGSDGGSGGGSGGASSGSSDGGSGGGSSGSSDAGSGGASSGSSDGGSGGVSSGSSDGGSGGVSSGSSDGGSGGASSGSSDGGSGGVSSGSSGESSSDSSGGDGEPGPGGDSSDSSEGSSSSSSDCSEGLYGSLVTVLDSNPELEGYWYAEDAGNGWIAVSGEEVEFRYSELGSDGLPLSSNVSVGGVVVASVIYPPAYLGTLVGVVYGGVLYCGVVEEGEIVL